MLQTSRPRVFRASLLWALKIFLSHSTAPAVVPGSAERGQGAWLEADATRPAGPQGQVGGQGRPSPQPRRTAARSPRPHALGPRPRQRPPPLPQPAASHPGAPWPEEVERPGALRTSSRCSESPATRARPFPAPPRATPRSGPAPTLGPGGRGAARRRGPTLSWPRIPAPGQRRHLPPLRSSQLQAGLCPDRARRESESLQPRVPEGTTHGWGQEPSEGRRRGRRNPWTVRGRGRDPNPKLGRVLAGASRDCWFAMWPGGDLASHPLGTLLMCP